MMRKKAFWICVSLSVFLLSLLFYLKGINVMTVLVGLVLALCPAIFLWIVYRSERASGINHRPER